MVIRALSLFFTLLSTSALTRGAFLFGLILILVAVLVLSCWIMTLFVTSQGLVIPFLPFSHAPQRCLVIYPLFRLRFEDFPLFRLPLLGLVWLGEPFFDAAPLVRRSRTGYRCCYYNPLV